MNFVENKDGFGQSWRDWGKFCGIGLFVPPSRDTGFLNFRVALSAWVKKDGTEPNRTFR